MTNAELFKSVRQRVWALQYLFEYNNRDINKLSVPDLLDEAYRFLNQSANDDFLKFCSKKENISFEEYKKMLLDG